MIKIKRTILVTAILISALSCVNKKAGVSVASSEKASSAVLKLPFKMPEVQIPKFKTDTLNIIDFGAVPNTEELCTKAINEAIAKCSESGGGVVVIPSGLWTTGPIKMKSNVNLHTKNGAYISFTSDLSQYKLIESYFEGNKVIRCESPIMGIDLENIAITGEGIFDGNGSQWRPVKIGKMTSNQWDELVKSGGVLSKDGKIWYPSKGAYIGNEERDKLPKIQTIANMEPFKESLRPVMVSFVNCKKLLLDGVTFQNSPAWNVNPLMCEHLTLRNLTIRNPWYSQNGDGLDIESCRIGTVTNCRFDVGDDAICIKSGKDKEGRERAKPTELFVITDCVVYHAHGGFVIGSEMSGGVRNIFVKNLTFNGTDCGLRFKSVRGRGGVVENIWMEDIRMNNIPTDAINFNLYYFGKSLSEDKLTGEVTVDKVLVSEETPVFKNMHFKNIYVNGAAQALKIMGIPEMPVENIQFQNMIIRSDVGIQMNYARKIDFKNIDLRLDKPGIAVSFSNSQNINIESIKAKGENQMFWVGGATTKDISLKTDGKKMVLDKDVKVLESIKDEVKLIE
ncbi:glycoside hydrolase family 28 protein [Flavobacterium hibernum]|uniref:Glycoside hydrolase n=1 Tax=Flavobacterium hibernum TaxID=37752 RepID=A0A0D0EE57_9FLAO|nr:glycoside hydrolase family 28 protein [Flavobacterium hibernum]KIO51774.1 glycoside hydrolase [Flavobacterium hibernum]OXA91809.1 glycoside hydrolase [Flavobacterium hibernum]STO09690.1 Exo-poly-alpha-D-galacturonosidase precursor [Flavobacterium hibernum]